MKKMKKLLGSVLLVVAAAMVFASCSDDEEVITDFKSGIVGTWNLIHPQGMADAGYVTWTFHPNDQLVGSSEVIFGGELEIFTSDWAAGDTTVYHRYGVYEDGRLHVWMNLPSNWYYTIVKMTTDRLVLNTVPQDNTAPTKIEFKRIKP